MKILYRIQDVNIFIHYIIYLNIFGKWILKTKINSKIDK